MTNNRYDVDVNCYYWIGISNKQYDSLVYDFVTIIKLYPLIVRYHVAHKYFKIFSERSIRKIYILFETHQGTFQCANNKCYYLRVQTSEGCLIKDRRRIQNAQDSDKRLESFSRVPPLARGYTLSYESMFLVSFLFRCWMKWWYFDRAFTIFSVIRS